MQANILDNSLIKHKITKLRDKNTGTKDFRDIVSEITMLLCYEILKDIPLKKIKVKTPLVETDGYYFDETQIVFVPILRAGMGMVDGIIKVIPNAKFGHIGLVRNEKSFEPETYYYKVPPNIQNKQIIILDPMLATGGSASSAISMLKKEGVKNIKFMGIIAAPEGIKKLNKDHPDVGIYCTSLDDGLNEFAYIVPGLGDAGDRVFGTK